MTGSALARLALVLAVASISMASAGCEGDARDKEEAPDSGQDIGGLDRDTLTVGSEVPFPPFEEGEPPGYEGFDIDVINAVADELGLEARIEDVPLRQILQGDSNALDLSISAVKITPSREQRVDFSNPYFIDQLSLLVRDDSQTVSVDDLSGATVGVEDGTTAETYAADELGAADVRAFSTAAEATTALLGSELDAVLVSVSAAQEALETKEGLTTAATYPTRDAFGIVLAEDDDDLRKAVNSALRKLKRDGTLTDLYEQYFGVEAPAGIAMQLRGPR